MQSFAPISTGQPKVLILGSMPSKKSLLKSQYYAHPQNSFWWIMSELFFFSPMSSYQQRCEELVLSSVAVWDVLASCDRQGSLDSNIVRDSEQANDILGLLKKYPSIRLIAFNGGAAKQIFMRHCGQVLSQSSSLELIQLPSTSPAHAAITRQQKLERWRAVFASAGIL